MRAPLQRAPLPLPLPLVVAVVAAALCRPAAASILVIQQHDDAAEYQLEDSPSRFGPHVSMAGIGGYLILAEPVTGCGPVDPPPSTPVRHHWILLISDDDCTSGEKVLSAQRAGYVAAIVFNTSGDGYSPMESNADVTIPSFYIGLSNGIMLRTNFLYGSGYSIYISGYFPYTFLAFIIPAMLLIVLCLLVLIGIMLYRCISEYRRTARRLLPKRMLAQIPTRRYGGAVDSGGAGGQDMCAICLEDYQEGDLLRVLPCRHAFHCQCVDPWLLRSRRVCPVCKRRLISATLAVLVSESEDEQLLPVYRSQRPPPGRRTYGATLTAHSAPAAASSAGDETRAGSRVRAPRRLRRTRRRQEARPSDPAGSVPTPASVSPAPAPAASAAGDDVSAVTDDVINSADNVRLLDDAAPLAVSPGQSTADVTEEPLDDAQSSLRPADRTRPQESHERDGLADGASESHSEAGARTGTGADLV